jgi:hypothetical protein
MVVNERAFFMWDSPKGRLMGKSQGRMMSSKLYAYGVGSDKKPEHCTSRTDI